MILEHLAGCPTSRVPQSAGMHALSVSVPEALTTTVQQQATGANLILSKYVLQIGLQPPQQPAIPVARSHKQARCLTQSLPKHKARIAQGARLSTLLCSSIQSMPGWSPAAYSSANDLLDEQ